MTRDQSIPLDILLSQIMKELKLAGLEQPQFEARQIVQEILAIRAEETLLRPDLAVPVAQAHVIRSWTRQRCAGVPLAYLCGHKGFFKHDFLVERGVLVPRPETELVVEVALERLVESRGDLNGHRRIADLGCGSGCIGLSLICEIRGAELWCVDQSAEACVLTRKNAERLKVEERVHIENQKVEDWEPQVRFDLIVANPPYIAADSAQIEEGVRKFEPHPALFAPEEGLAALRDWSRWASGKLTTGGLFVTEFGAGQAKSVGGFLARAGFSEIRSVKDLAGHERVISGIKME